ncbi:hypothetical protein [Bacillus sp. SM2101]|nr:hypothetical protein [Bacillus sp. SM2101]
MKKTRRFTRTGVIEDCKLYELDNYHEVWIVKWILYRIDGKGEMHIIGQR